MKKIFSLIIAAISLAAFADVSPFPVTGPVAPIATPWTAAWLIYSTDTNSARANMGLGNAATANTNSFLASGLGGYRDGVLITNVIALRATNDAAGNRIDTTYQTAAQVGSQISGANLVTNGGSFNGAVTSAAVTNTGVWQFNGFGGQTLTFGREQFPGVADINLVDNFGNGLYVASNGVVTVVSFRNADLVLNLDGSVSLLTSNNTFRLSSTLGVVTLNGSNLLTSVGSNNLSGPINSRQIDGLLPINLLPTNVYASTFAVILHPNKTFSVFTNGPASAPVTIAVPNSTSAGFNEAMGVYRTVSNSPAGGFRMLIDPGLYLPTTQLLVTNKVWVSAAGSSATIFRFVGSTNLATIAQMTNILNGASGTACAQRAAPYSLLYCSTNLQNQGGIEQDDAYSVKLEGFTIQPSTNMPCIGITISGGDQTVLNDVFVGGPELWTVPSYYNGFFEFDMVPNSSSMIGMVIGDNQVILNHCGFAAVADGLVPIGNSLLKVNDANFIQIGNYVNADGATPYPATSEFSTMNGILVPKISQCEKIIVNNPLFFGSYNDFYFGEPSLVAEVNDWMSQDEIFNPFNMEIWRGSSTYPIVRTEGIKDPITVQTYTNDATGFHQNLATNSYLVNLPITADGLFQISDGHNIVMQVGRTGVFWAGPVNNDVQAAAGREFVGLGSGLTNVPTVVTNLFIQTNITAAVAGTGATNALSFIGLGIGTNVIYGNPAIGTAYIITFDPGVETEADGEAKFLLLTNGVVVDNLYDVGAGATITPSYPQNYTISLVYLGSNKWTVYDAYMAFLDNNGSRNSRVLSMPVSDFSINIGWTGAMADDALTVRNYRIDRIR